MIEIKYYYRLTALGIDISDEKEVKENSRELHSFNDLSTQFDLLKKSYDTQDKERADIMVCVLQNVAKEYLNDVVEISVYHRIVKKLFSKEIQKNVFSLCATMGERDLLYFYETTDFDEVKKIFYDYITNQSTPDLSMWERKSY